MLRLKLGDNETPGRHAQLENIATAAETLRQSKESRLATDFLLQGIGLQTSPVHNESYFSEALDYYLAALYAHLEQPDRARAHLERVGVLPGAGGDPLFSDHVRELIELRRQMLAARERGVPFILMASMPRSASASLTQSLSATMNAPVMRMSLGKFPHFYLMPQWLAALSAGGAITHDHFDASPFNLKVLSEAGFRDIFVLIRDPRAAAASYVKWISAIERTELSSDEMEQRIVECSVASYYPWLADWIAAKQGSEVKVHWIKSSDVRTNLAGTIACVLRHFRDQYPGVEKLLDAVKEVKANFVVGDDDAWRSSVSPIGKERLWQALPQRALELLGLMP